MRKSGLRVLAATAAMIANALVCSCKYDTEPEDSKKNEQTGTKLTVVWDNYATEEGYKLNTDSKKKVFISTMINGVQTLPDTEAELPVYDKNSINLDNYEAEYKAKLGIGDKYFTKPTVCELDAAIRYMSSGLSNGNIYVCQFVYYSDAEYTNKISSVDVAETDIIVYVRANRSVENWSILTSTLAREKNGN